MDSELDFPNYEKLLWDTIKKIDVSRYISPTNLEEEKEIFFDNYKKKYNPNFTYHDNPLQEETKENIRELINFFSNSRNKYSKNYLHLIKNANHVMEIFSIKNTKRIHGIYGKPSRDNIDYAYKNIKKIKIEVNKIIDEEVTDLEAIDYFKIVLVNCNFHDWSISIKPQAAKVMINTLDKEVSIRESSRFSHSEIKRLTIHEIGTHVLRFENGKKQEFSIFQHGFSDYLECEEGLAIYSEYKTGTLGEQDLLKYYLRVIACDLCESHGFFEVFNTIKDYCSKDLAFYITARVKRGLEDTSKKYGYTKDQVYLSGFLKVKNLSEEQIKNLYVGKIGFEQLDNIDFRGLNVNEILIPYWI